MQGLTYCGVLLVLLFDVFLVRFVFLHVAFVTTQRRFVVLCEEEAGCEVEAKDVLDS